MQRRTRSPNSPSSPSAPVAVTCSAAGLVDARRTSGHAAVRATRPSPKAPYTTAAAAAPGCVKSCATVARTPVMPPAAALPPAGSAARSAGLHGCRDARLCATRGRAARQTCAGIEFEASNQGVAFVFLFCEDAHVTGYTRFDALEGKRIAGWPVKMLLPNHATITAHASDAVCFDHTELPRRWRRHTSSSETSTRRPETTIRVPVTCSTTEIRPVASPDLEATVTVPCLSTARRGVDEVKVTRLEMSTLGTDRSAEDKVATACTCSCWYLHQLGALKHCSKLFLVSWLSWENKLHHACSWKTNCMRAVLIFCTIRTDAKHGMHCGATGVVAATGKPWQ